MKRREVKAQGGEGREEEEEQEAEEAYLNNGSNKALTEKKTRGHHAAPKAVIIKFPCTILHSH